MKFCETLTIIDSFLRQLAKQDAEVDTTPKLAQRGFTVPFAAGAGNITKNFHNSSQHEVSTVKLGL